MAGITERERDRESQTERQIVSQTNCQTDRDRLLFKLVEPRYFHVKIKLRLWILNRFFVSCHFTPAAAASAAANTAAAAFPYPLPATFSSSIFPLLSPLLIAHYA